MSGLVLSALAACTPESLFLALPDTASARSLLMFSIGAAGTTGTAFDLERGSPRFDLLASEDATGSLEAWLYQAPLGELELEAGPLALVRAPAGRPLPRPDAVQLAGILEDELGPWRPGSAEAALSRGLRVDAPDPCAVGALEFLGWGSLAAPRFAVSLPSGPVLLGGPEAELSVLSSSGLERIDNPLGLLVTHGVLEASSSPPRLWLRTEDGAIHRGPAELPLDVTRAETATVPDVLHFDAGLTPDGAEELYLVDGDGRFLRVLGRELRAIHRFQARAFLPIARVARSRTGEAVAAMYGSPETVRYRDGVLSLLQPLADPFETFGAVIWSDRYLGVTSKGAVLRLEGEAWREIGRGLSIDLLAVMPVAGGFWVAGGDGYLAKLPITAPACAPLPVGGSAIYSLALMNGRDLVVVPGGFDAAVGDVRIGILRPE